MACHAKSRDLMSRPNHHIMFHTDITSDCGAVENVQNDHHYTDTPNKTVTAVLTAGMDTDCGGYDHLPSFCSKSSTRHAHLPQTECYHSHHDSCTFEPPTSTTTVTCFQFILCCGQQVVILGNIGELCKFRSTCLCNYSEHRFVCIFYLRQIDTTPCLIIITRL